MSSANKRLLTLPQNYLEVCLSQEAASSQVQPKPSTNSTPLNVSFEAEHRADSIPHALPLLRSLYAQTALGHHPPQSQDNALCFQVWNVQAITVSLSGFWSSDI